MASADKTSYVCPPSFMLQKLYGNMCKHLSKNVLRKLKDSSTLKSNLANPHNRDVQVINVSKLVYAGVYGKLFSSKEKICEASNKSSPVFSLNSLERLQAIFTSEGLVKFHNGGDVSLITSWFVLGTPFEIDTTILQQGRLLIPLKEKDDCMTVFIPCGGPDPETDQLPSWSQTYTIDEIISVKAEQLQYKLAEGAMSAIAKQNYTVIRKNQVEENNFILIRGQYLKVYAIAVDFNSDERNVVRFTQDLKYNVNKQKFSIGQLPKVHGKIIDIPNEYLKEEKLVTVTLQKIDDEDIGTMFISFRNACFNSLGFLTHDTAIHM